MPRSRSSSRRESIGIFISLPPPCACPPSVPFEDRSSGLDLLVRHVHLLRLEIQTHRLGTGGCDRALQPVAVADEAFLRLHDDLATDAELKMSRDPQRSLQPRR